MIYLMFETLQGRLGHSFQNTQLLRVALTHRSYHFEHKKDSSGHFERLEFLGDAVLDLVLSETLMNTYPDVEEGTLSKWRASLVNEAALAEIGKSWELGRYLFLGRSEEAQRDNARPRLLASAFEALVAAVYMDGGMEAARALIAREFDDKVKALSLDNEFAQDFKTRLQEWTQKRFHVTPEYRLAQSEGPEHAKHFVFEVIVDGKVLGSGEGSSRKNAEQAAARSAIEKLGESL
ncbi:MAG: ribonuclease III [Bdellovibrionales bacterium]|nr:ribonuclease III [Bdellovibrionales bacterium]